MLLYAFILHAHTSSVSLTSIGLYLIRHLFQHMQWMNKCGFINFNKYVQRIVRRNFGRRRLERKHTMCATHKQTDTNTDTHTIILLSSARFMHKQMHITQNAITFIKLVLFFSSSNVYGLWPDSAHLRLSAWLFSTVATVDTIKSNHTRWENSVTGSTKPIRNHMSHAHEHNNNNSDLSNAFEYSYKNARQFFLSRRSDNNAIRLTGAQDKHSGE